MRAVAGRWVQPTLLGEEGSADWAGPGSAALPGPGPESPGARAAANSPGCGCGEPQSTRPWSRAGSKEDALGRVPSPGQCHDWLQDSKQSKRES